jgi:hypothetical protein
MTLSNYQFAFDGWSFGAGTPYVVQNIDGLGGTSAIRNQDDIRGYIDGSFSGRDFYDARTVTFDILVTGDSSHNAQYYYKQLQSNLSPQTLGYYPNAYNDANSIAQPTGTLGLFQFQLVSDSFSGDSSVTGNRRMWGRVRLVTTPLDPDFSYGYIMTTVEFYFPDPRYYDETLKTPTSGTSVALTNNGWATTCPLIVISTPAASGSIADSNGNSMGFANVATGFPLVIDLLTRTITQNGGYARNTLTSFNYWLSVAGSSANTFTSTVGAMSVYYRNAYL